MDNRNNTNIGITPTHNEGNISLNSYIINNNNNSKKNMMLNNMNNKIDLNENINLMENIFNNFTEISNINYNTKFKEEINKEMCDYLLSLPNDSFINEIFDTTDETLNPENTSKWNTNNYAKYVKKILIKFKNNNYILDKIYHQNQNLGRRFISEGGIQGIQNRLKGALMIDGIYDYDMINAHPTILLYIVNKFYPNIPCNYLKDYINNRNNILEKNNLTKIDINIIINSNIKKKTENIWLKNFNTEIIQIQNIIFNDFKNIIPNTFKQNKEGEILNKILCVYENFILEKIVNYCNDNYIKIDSLIFDGLHIRNPNLIDKFNEITDEFKIVWKIKHFDKSLKINVGLIPTLTDDFEIIKSLFENNHFMILNPLNYCVEKDNKIILYNKTTFSDIVAPFKYHIYKDGREEHTYCFFNKWIDCLNRRAFDEIKFVPYPKICPSNIYNEFKGFDYELWNIKKNEDDFSIFQNHLKLLMGNELNTELFNNMEIWLGSIIAEPANLTGTAFFIRSIDGLGKNIFFKNFFKAVLYNDCYMETSNPKDLFGTFADTEKIFIAILNEVKGNSSFNLDNLMKTIIADDTKIIEKKGIQSKIVNNYLRLMAFCNPEVSAPIKISLTDRRWICIDNTNKVPEQIYFTNLINALKNKQIMLNYVEYLKDLFNKNKNYDWIKNRPKTEYYRELQQVNIGTTYKFIFYLLMKTELILEFGALQLYKKYQKYMHDYGYSPISNTAFGREISNMEGITKKRTTKGNNYFININIFLTDCVKKNIINEDFMIDLLDR